MKFSEKLMNLRKSKGWSQDDLAEKLNVTRQTISKWELDQTAPDMNKLVEISKLFGISLDELVEKENNKEKNSKSSIKVDDKKVVKIVLIIILLIVISLFMFFAVNTILPLIIFKNTAKSVIDTAGNVMERQVTESDTLFNIVDDSQFNDIFKSTKSLISEQLNEQTNDMNISTFNSKFENYSGLVSGLSVSSLLDNVTNSNNSNKDKIITVIYKDNTVTDENSIIEIRDSLDTFSNYNVLLGYDSDGYVNKVAIKDI